jgi:GxxExxY protein
LESLYEENLIIELKNKGLFVNSQDNIIPYYKNIKLSARLRYDILVEDLILVENKSVVSLNPIDTAQLLSYMEVMKKPKDY